MKRSTRTDWFDSEPLDGRVPGIDGSSDLGWTFVLAISDRNGFPLF